MQPVECGTARLLHCIRRTRVGADGVDAVIGDGVDPDHDALAAECLHQPVDQVRFFQDSGYLAGVRILDDRQIPHEDISSKISISGHPDVAFHS